MATRQALRELGALYDDARGRITDLVSNLDDPKSIEVTAVTPWTVHDLVAHLTGNCADVMKGNVAGVATEEWTNAQVEERKERSTSEVLDEWAEVGPAFASMVDDFPGNYGLMVVGDVTVHEHDIRAALGEPGERDSAAVEMATHFAISVVVGSGAKSLGVGPLEIRTPDRTWIVGTGGAATNDPESWRDALMAEYKVNDRRPVGTVSGPLFDVFRSVTGRRSADQVRELDWGTDPEKFVPIFGFGPFKLRTSDLNE